jgi:hypothetical protein
LPSTGTVDIGKVLYASPVKPMYDTGTGSGNGKSADDPSDFNLLEHNYSLVRYAWSLRGLSVARNIDAVWVFYAPFRTLADKMINAAHTDTLTDDTDEALVRQTQVVRACMSRPDGSVTFLFKETVFPLTRLEGRSAQPLLNQPDRTKFDPKLPFRTFFDKFAWRPTFHATSATRPRREADREVPASELRVRQRAGLLCGLRKRAAIADSGFRTKHRAPHRGRISHET